MAIYLEKILKTVKSYGKAYGPPLGLVGVLLNLSCKLPERASNQWGWEEKQGKDSRSEYERSLKSEFLEDGENKGKDPWRVLNYMMYFLAKGKAEAEGVGSSTRNFLDKLGNLNVVYDSAKVDAVYGQIFVDEDQINLLMKFLRKD